MSHLLSPLLDTPVLLHMGRKEAFLVVARWVGFLLPVDNMCSYMIYFLYG